MLDYQIAFDSPWYLALLALLPFLWFFSLRSLAGLGRWRKFAAIALRTLVLTLFVLALAELQLVRTSDRVTVMYLVDQSQSISNQQSAAMLDYVNAGIKTRDKVREDRAGVIIFGRDAAIEIPPLDDDQSIPRVESSIDREYTNLAAAMKLAQASFPHDTAKRIVILSDGNENIGDALEQGRALADAGIGIDTIPIRSAARGDVAVEKVVIPSDVRRGQPFDLRVVVNNTAASAADRHPVKGRLQVVRKSGDHEQILSDDAVELPPGKRVFTIREEIDQPDFYTYEARFVPDNPDDDSIPENNRATTFTHVRGRGQVLLIEDHESRGDFTFLVERLRKANLEVAVRTTAPEEMFADLGQLQPFDTVLLGNVPREHFSDEQIQMLVRNTQNLGSGLIMLGGPNSFGAGGWTGTPLEEAMPVDFQIKSAKVVPVGALAMLMHASEMPDGNHWQKIIAREALKALGDQDYCGVLHFTGRDEWLWRGMLKVGPNKTKMLTLLDHMTPGDMPAFDTAMALAGQGLSRLPDAAIKHMIVISDGDPAAPLLATMQVFKNIGAKVSTVAIGAHGPAGHRTLKDMADFTGGKYYTVANPKMLPKIYQREARRVARPLVYENAAGVQPRVKFQHEMLQGIGQVPRITGFVLTTVKDSALVEVSMISPLPAEEANGTILASWTYGLGKVVAFTTDAGHRWAADWTKWEGYDKLFSQMVRWSMRPVGDTGKFSVATEVQEGKVKVVVTALDKDDQFVNFLNLGGVVVSPDMKPIDVQVKQTAPGRYVGEFDAKEKGSYFVMLNPGPGRAPIRAGVNVSYSDEYRARPTNEPLLRNLAGLVPKNGTAGRVIDAPKDLTDNKEFVATLLKSDEFRRDLPKATSSQDVWHLLILIGGCLFFVDVFVRRVSINFAWAAPLAIGVKNFILRREAQPATTETMQRLRSRKAEVADQLDQKRSATRFEPTPDVKIDLEKMTKELSAEAPPKRESPTPGQPGLAPEKQEEESYTSRLLKAKQKVWEERKKDEPPK